MARTRQTYRNHYNFKELLDICYKKDWIPHCKKTFNGANSVINYLGKYTHRIAISNHRIIRMDENTVTFSVEDYREEDILLYAEIFWDVNNIFPDFVPWKYLRF